jgi:drug/metabolite transporter (DMT)-like permease
LNRGVIYAVLAALSFSLQNATVKELSVTMGTGEIAFFRGTLSAIIIIVLMKIQDVHFSHEDRPTLILRGIFGGLGMICLFYGLRGVPLADASILSQLSAFFVMLFAAVFLKELIPKGAILPLAVIVCGASLVVRPWHFDAFNVYSLFVLAQAVLAAAAYTTVSRLTASGKHHQYEIVLYFLICAAIAGAVLMGRDFRMPDMTEWGFCIALGIFSVLGQIWITRSYMYGNAVVVSFVAYIAVFFNSLWGYVFYGEIMTAMTLTGGILIIGGSMYLTKLKHDRISARNKAGA